MLAILSRSFDFHDALSICYKPIGYKRHLPTNGASIPQSSEGVPPLGKRAASAYDGKMKIGRAIIVVSGIVVLGGFFTLLVLSNAAEKQRVWGFIDTAGEVVIPIEFDDARDFAHGRAAVAVGGKWGFVDRTGSPVIEAIFEAVGDFTAEDLAWARLDGRDGYLRPDGTWAISPRFDRATSFETDVTFAAEVVGRTTTRVSGSMGQPIYSYGLIGRDGEWIVRPRDDADPEYWSSVGGFSEGLAAVQVGGRAYGYIDTEGTFVVPPIYERADRFTAGVALTRPTDGGFRFIDATGAEVLSLGVTSVAPGEEGFLTVYGSLADEEGAFLANLDGGVYLGPYDAMGRYTEGRLTVQDGESWYAIDIDERRYGVGWDSMEPFSEGLAAVARSGNGILSDYTWGFIDRNGNVVVEPAYDRVAGFSQGLARVALR